MVGLSPAPSGARKPQAPKSTATSRLRLWIQLMRPTRGIETELRNRLRVEFAVTLPRFDVVEILRPMPVERANAVTLELRELRERFSN